MAKPDSATDTNDVTVPPGWVKQWQRLRGAVQEYLPAAGWVVKIAQLEQRVTALEAQGVTLMTISQELAAKFAAIDDKTNQLAAANTELAAGVSEVASDLQVLRDQIGGNEGRPSAEEIMAKLDEVGGRLSTQVAAAQAVALQLTLVGQDPVAGGEGGEGGSGSGEGGEGGSGSEGGEGGSGTENG
jgi:hypothetical protein